MDVSKQPRLGLEERYPGFYTLLDAIGLTLEDLIRFCDGRPPVVNSLAVKFNAPQPYRYQLGAYLRRFAEHSGASNECFVLMLIYIDRLVTNNLLSLTTLNLHRVVTTGMLLAAKYFDDNFYFNPTYDNVGGIPKGDTGPMEVDFLTMLDFRLHVPREQYEQFYQYLVQSSLNRNLVTCHLFMPKPLAVFGPVGSYVEEEAPNFMPVPIHIITTPYTLQYHVDFELDESLQRQMLDERKKLSQLLQQQKQQNAPISQQLLILQQQQQLFQAQAQFQLRLKKSYKPKTAPPGFECFVSETLCFDFNSKCQVQNNSIYKQNIDMNNIRIPNQLDYLTRAHTEPNNYELNKKSELNTQLGNRNWMTHSMSNIPVKNISTNSFSALNPNASAYCFLGERRSNPNVQLEMKQEFGTFQSSSEFGDRNIEFNTVNSNSGWKTKVSIDADFFKVPRAPKTFNTNQYF